MLGLGTKNKPLFKQQWQGSLSEYVTAIDWSPNETLATSSAAGEVVLWQGENLISLLPVSEQSIDCLAFSFDGQFLAAGGQDGKVRIWKFQDKPELITTLKNAPKWIDKISWSPINNRLAFSLGRYVQIWDALTQTVVATLPFVNSSVLDISWRPNGKHLAIAGNGGVKVWDTKDWDEDPYSMETQAASIAIAWSSDGKYIASANLDNTVTVLAWDAFIPWVMQGFPGKISNLAWSQPLHNDAPLLAASSMEGIAVWKKQIKEEDGWNGRVLKFHGDKIKALRFQPNSLLLASAAEDGWLCLWSKAKQAQQLLEGAPNGFSCLAWQREGKQLAAGGQNGEIIVWSQSYRGKGFG
ncbi:MAG: WD40 repeat domain-containing protein [Xenococcaceae cyanobacterium]